MKEISTLIDETARLASETKNKRNNVRKSAVDTIFKLEEALQAALDGTSLRGLKNLSGDDKGSPDIYDAVCTSCGTSTQVPYRPAANRPVICATCRSTPRRSPQPFYGARVRANPDAKLVWPTEPEDETSTLCITPKGALVMVVCATDEYGDPIDIEQYSAVFDDILVEDVDGLMRALAVILPRHIESSKRASERFDAVAQLCNRLDAAIGG
jgi:CxxC-x17-CxxC domain-containing protein